MRRLVVGLAAGWGIGEREGDGLKRSADWTWEGYEVKDGCRARRTEYLSVRLDVEGPSYVGCMMQV